MPARAPFLELSHHPNDAFALRRLEQERVQMIRHQHVSVAFKTKFLAIAFKEFQDSRAHGIVTEPTTTNGCDRRNEMNATCKG